MEIQLSEKDLDKVAEKVTDDLIEAKIIGGHEFEVIYAIKETIKETILGLSIVRK